MYMAGGAVGLMLNCASAVVGAWNLGTVMLGAWLANEVVKFAEVIVEVMPGLLIVTLNRSLMALSSTNAILNPARIDVLPFPVGSHASDTFGAKLFQSFL